MARSSARERERSALELRKAGATPERIAQALGFKDTNSVLAAIKAQLDASAPESPSDALKLELERLDAMQRALWPEAMKGKWLAVDRCLSIMERRARLLGLDGSKQEAPTKDPVDELKQRRERRTARGARAKN